MSKKLEADLANPVADWMRLEGYTVYSEVPFSSRCIDMVGLIKPDKIRVVELKLRFGKNGIRQAVVCQMATPDIYLAVGGNPRLSSIDLCKKYGVGLLQINNGEVKVLNCSHKKVEPWRMLSKHLIENCLSFEPSDKAGVPCMSGCGPAQAVGVCVRQYVEEHPKAGWREIFNNVPNHYSNYQSMTGAMNGYLGLSLTRLRELRVQEKPE